MTCDTTNPTRCHYCCATESLTLWADTWCCPDCLAKLFADPEPTE